MSGNKNKIALRTIFIGICGFFFILSSSIFITLNSIWLYRLFVATLNLNETVNLTVKGLMNEYHRIILYLELPWIHRLETTLPMSNRALMHFKDVKNLVIFNNGVLIFSLSSLIVINSRNNYFIEWWKYLRALRWNVLGMLLVVVLGSVNFNQTFIFFHRIFFHNDNWLFNPTFDPIINALPESFFAACFVEFVIVYMIMNLIVYVYVKKYKCKL
ncbi:hypothetical protein FC40_GL000421 [Ligilactobacillus hayakitensis DSM 18933 = JCM 14209]|uniref:Integral membrane protein n=1 Tax=Ligilactobacillus hayakitensis DSM 18933 = JCM 14209 TaxID=1423755 RepID=A0A0R1WU82_9LACO|nr:TIGR01906 family membrane protein [Ligilactobacillus hayakitensis]KRM19257.1 hypothetical protein FC40_GL000421 [Ligilactobacillus hayakitensis DSM 18933 = JCM 14209]